MRRTWLLLMVVCAGCTTQNVGVSNGKARFTEYPDRLIAAFSAACEGPAQSFLRPSQDLVECREYLPPEPTAAIILQFDGTPSDLPELVIQFRTEELAPGYIVSNEIFLNVPQKTGSPLRVRMEYPRVQRSLDALYRLSGGVPDRDAPTEQRGPFDGS